MNHPEYRQIIVFDDSVFEVGDTVAITTIRGEEYTGDVTDIKEDHFAIQLFNGYLISFYDEVVNIELMEPQVEE